MHVTSSMKSSVLRITLRLMTRNKFLRLAHRVLTLPTATYHEHAVREFVLKFCRDLGLRVESDRGAMSLRNIDVVSGECHWCSLHTWIIPASRRSSRIARSFFGGVPRELFKNGCVRFFADGKVVRVRVKQLDGAAWPKRKLVEFDNGGRIRRGDFGMWDVPAFRAANGKLHAAIDDVLSVVVGLANLTVVKGRRSNTHGWGAFARRRRLDFMSRWSWRAGGRSRVPHS
jgi:hypothetical protein